MTDHNENQLDGGAGGPSSWPPTCGPIRSARVPDTLTRFTAISVTQRQPLKVSQSYQSDEEIDDCFVLVPPPLCIEEVPSNANPTVARSRIIHRTSRIHEGLSEHTPGYFGRPSEVNAEENDDEVFVLVPPPSLDVDPDPVLTRPTGGLKPRPIPEATREIEFVPPSVHDEAGFVEGSFAAEPIPSSYTEEEQHTGNKIVPTYAAVIPRICFTPPRDIRLPMRPSCNPFDVPYVPEMVGANFRDSTAIVSSGESSLSVGGTSVRVHQVPDLSTPKLDSNRVRHQSKGIPRNSGQQHGQHNVSPWSRRTIRVPMM